MGYKYTRMYKNIVYLYKKYEVYAKSYFSDWL